MPSPCASPFLIYRSGEHTYKDAARGRVVRSTAPCGRCDPCVAMRKQEWTGRLIAEGLASASVAFVTLTYKEKPERFDYGDVQAMLKRLRMALWRKHQCKVRFLAVGERGDAFKRIHWHLLLFLDKPIQLGPWGKETHPGQLWEHWEHGWTTISNVDAGLMAVKARYCIKYAIKGHGRGDLPRARMSLKPGLGVPYLVGQARQWARRGIVPQGWYHLPGAIWERGTKKGQHQKFRLSGCCRAEVIEAWRNEWALTYPGRDVPVNKWLMKYDDEAIWERDPRQRISYIPGRLPTIYVSELRAEKKMSEGRYLVFPDGRSCYVAVRSDGAAAVFQHGNEVFWHAGWPVYDTFTEVLDLAPREAIRLDAWMRKLRGPQYRSPYAIEAETVQQKRERWKAAAREWTIQTIREQRKRHGVSRTAHGIYSTRYDPYAPGQGFITDPGEGCIYDPLTGEVVNKDGSNPAFRSLADYGCYGCDTDQEQAATGQAAGE